MGVYVLERRQSLRASIDEVFPFFENPVNLEELTPSWLGFRILDASDASVQAGTLIQYRLNWGPFGMNWRSRITEYEPGRMFADEMLQGPYRSWYHRHVFTPVSDGVEMYDRVEYEMPFGPLGRIAHGLVVRRQLEAIFDFRARAVGQRFDAAEPARRAEPIDEAGHVITASHAVPASRAATASHAVESIAEATGS